MAWASIQETYPSLEPGSPGILTFGCANFGDRNQYFDVLVDDLVSNTTELVSVPNPAFAFPSADGPSVLLSGAFSTEASYVAFVSDADNLTPGFLHQRLPQRLCG